MCPDKDLHEKIAAFHGKVNADRHHRYRSWEHCYTFFRSRNQEGVAAQRELAALHLGFYLASWGMYRGSAFLLQRTYTVHLDVIDSLVSPRFSELWRTEVGAVPATAGAVAAILSIVEAVRDAYAPFGPASDILITKVLLGTVGCLPAVDRFFVAGFRKSHRPYSYLNRSFVERIIGFCNECGGQLRSEQSRIEASDRVYYPLMKLADMYFWQTGYDGAPPKVRLEAGPI
jgi:hypothetical protein